MVVQVSFNIISSLQLINRQNFGADIVCGEHDDFAYTVKRFPAN